MNGSPSSTDGATSNPHLLVSFWCAMVEEARFYALSSLIITAEQELLEAQMDLKQWQLHYHTNDTPSSTPLLPLPLPLCSTCSGGNGSYDRASSSSSSSPWGTPPVSPLSSSSTSSTPSSHSSRPTTPSSSSLVFTLDDDF
jgi:hypothetical protein